MKKIFNFLFLFLIFILSIYIVFPKERIYYAILEKIQKYKVTIHSQHVKSHLFGFELQNASVFLAGSKIATIKNIYVTPLISQAENFNTFGTFKNTLPHINDVKISLNPNNFISADGNFGSIRSQISFKTKKITIQSQISDETKTKYNMIFNQFKQVGDKYVYEISF